MEEYTLPQKENIKDVLKKYKEQKENLVHTDTIPRTSNIPNDYQKVMSKETDPDLMIAYEIVKLPSKGLFYANGLSEVNVEYMTSKDEDLLTTPSLIESGSVLDLLLKRKIKTQGVNPEDLLAGDRNAIILFLRTSSYGHEYNVQVTDPRNNNNFKTVVNLLDLKYKELSEIPDENGHFKVLIPMRNKLVTFRLITSGEDNQIFKNAEAIKEAYHEDFSQYSTLKLKASIIAVDEKRDRSYIDKFVDAMPALDAFTIRKKILDISPDVDMTYEFTAKDGFKFKASLSIGLDFFFPQI
jgi:hypothetical protein